MWSSDQHGATIKRPTVEDHQEPALGETTSCCHLHGSPIFAEPTRQIVGDCPLKPFKVDLAACAAHHRLDKIHDGGRRCIVCIISRERKHRPLLRIAIISTLSSSPSTEDGRIEAFAEPHSAAYFYSVFGSHLGKFKGPRLSTHRDKLAKLWRY